MNEKDPLDNLDDQISNVPSVPDLKKKDEERKRAGAAWDGGRPAGTPFSGATGGSGAARAASAAPAKGGWLGEFWSRFLGSAVTEAGADLAGSQSPLIPNLKKVDQERRRAGAAWGGGRPVGTPFAGATGGSGAAGVQAAAGVGRAAIAAAPGGAGAVQGAVGAAQAAAGAPGWLAALFPGSAGWLGGASASFLSKAMIGLGVASLLAGVGLYAVLKLREKPAGPEGAGMAPIYDTIQINRNASDKRLQMAAEAGRGQFQFDPKAETPAEAAAPAETTAAAEEKPAENPWGDILSAVQGPQGFAAQNLAGLPSGSSGMGSMGGLFSSLTGANSGGRGGKMPSLRYPGQKGKLSGAMARGATRSSPASGMSTRKIRSGRAFAQLRYARSQSLTAARGGASEQGMKATAADAFEQNDGQSASGAGLIGPVDSEVAANPGTSHGEYGSGTPQLLSNPNDLPNEVPSTPGVITPSEQDYQNALNAIKDLAKMAAKLKMISMILIAIGIALIAAGCSMTPVGWGLIAAGIALVAMGMMMLSMAKQMGAQAKAMEQQLESAYGQQYQQENVDACVNQAIANGTDPDACQSPNPDPHYNDSATDATGVQKAVKDERDSNWEYDDGAGPASQR